MLEGCWWLVGRDGLSSGGTRGAFEGEGGICGGEVKEVQVRILDSAGGFAGVGEGNFGDTDVAERI